MIIEELLVYGNKYLHKDKVKLILSTILSINPLELTINLDKKIDKDLIDKYKKAIDYVKDGKPIQYALSNACFYGYDFYVNENVLIPRFETEELVFNTLNYLNKYFENPKVLDMCTGSGCIGLTMKKENPTISITLADISNKALDVLKINLEKLGINGEVIQTDLFENISCKYDVLVSNPPYISYNDEVDELVKNNEPAIALYADNNGLSIYERLLKDCETYLNDKYMIALEIGANQKDSVIEIINKYLKNVSIITKKDASNRDRIIFVFKNINLNE